MPVNTQVHHATKIIVKKPRKYQIEGFSTTEIIIIDEKGHEMFCLTVFAEIADGVPVLVHSGCPATVEA